MAKIIGGSGVVGAGLGGCIWLAALLFIAVLGRNQVVAEMIYQDAGLIDPGSYVMVNETGIVGPNSTLSMLNVTVTGRMCGVDVFASRDPSACSGSVEGLEGFEAGLSLKCGFGTMEEVAASTKLISSQYVGGNQTVLIGNQGGTLTLNDTGTLGCLIIAEGYNPGPVAYDLEVSSVDSAPTLVAEQAIALGNVYDVCCEGGCTGWGNGGGRRRALRSRSLLQAAPEPEPNVPVPSPEAVVPAPGPDAEVPAPGPDAVVPAPVPEPGVVGAQENFCQFSGSICNDAGELVTLDLSNMGLSCDIVDLAEELRNVTTLERLSLSGNPDLTGTLRDALGVFAEMKNDSITVLENPWTDILVSKTGVDGSLVDVELGGSPLCEPGLLTLEQLAFEGTQMSGPLDSCMFGNGSSLQVLLGSYSQISSLTDSFAQAPRMRNLQMINASLSGVVTALPEFLGEFQVSNNTLNGSLPLPSTYLAWYDGSNNGFSGQVQDEFGGSYLRVVDLDRNELNGLPSAWVDRGESTENTDPLQVLSLSNNPLNVTYPDGLASYRNLTLLAMSNTTLSGDLPDLAPGAFPSLTTLRVDVNNITGTVPDSWQNITLFTRDFTGERLGNFSFNQMSGDLPSWLADYPPKGSDTVYDFAGNSFGNGCEPTYQNLNACGGSYQPAPAPTPAPEAPAPAPQPDSKGSSEDSPSGSSVAFAVFVTLVSLVILGIGGYFVYKWWKGRQNQGTFQRYMDSGSSVVQMVSNQTYV